MVAPSRRRGLLLAFALLGTAGCSSGGAGRATETTRPTGTAAPTTTAATTTTRDPGGPPTTPTATVEVGGDPLGLVFGAGSLWVAGTASNPGAPPCPGGRVGCAVARIDPATNAVVATIDLPDRPDSIAFGAGLLWLAVAGNILRIDPATGQTLGSSAVAGSHGLAFGEGAAWTVDPLRGVIARIDPVTGAVGPFIAVGTAVGDLTVADGAVWVSQPDVPSVLRFVALTGTRLFRLQTGHVVSRLEVGLGSVWALSPLDGELDRVDLSTSTVGARFRMPQPLSALAFGADAVWGGSAARRLWRIDPKTGEITDTVNLAAAPTEIAASGRSVWAIPFGSTQLDRYDR